MTSSSGLREIAHIARATRTFPQQLQFRGKLVRYVLDPFDDKRSAA